MRLRDRRVLVTQADEYMGPAIVELFRAEGAQVMADVSDLRASSRCDELLAGAGELDILIANLAHPPCAAAVTELDERDCRSLFEALVYPLMRLVRGAARPMVAARRGKIVAITSAAPLRGVPGASAYCAARGAQNAFVRAVGLELAAHNVQLNAVAQNYVHNDSYYPDELVTTERFQKHLARQVPLGRLARASESAELALFLAGEHSDFFVGQVVPFAGGWAT